MSALGLSFVQHHLTNALAISLFLFQVGIHMTQLQKHKITYLHFHHIRVHILSHSLLISCLFQTQITYFHPSRRIRKPTYLGIPQTLVFKSFHQSILGSVYTFYTFHFWDLLSFTILEKCFYLLYTDSSHEHIYTPNSVYQSTTNSLSKALSTHLVFSTWKMLKMSRDWYI